MEYKKPKIDLSKLSEDNLYRALVNRGRYSEGNTIYYGFVAVFCLTKEENIIKFEDSYTEMSKTYLFNQVGKLHDLDMMDAIAGESLIHFDVDTFMKHNPHRKVIPSTIIGMCATSCSNRQCLSVLYSKYHPKLWQNADVIYTDLDVYPDHYQNLIKL